MPGRPIDAVVITRLLKKDEPISAQVHGLVYRHLAFWYDAQHDDAGLVIALRGEGRLPRPLREPIARGTREIITRDATARFGDQAATALALAVLDRALSQVSWPAVAEQVHQLTRTRLLGDKALGRRADERAASTAATTSAKCLS